MCFHTDHPSHWPVINNNKIPLVLISATHLISLIQPLTLKQAHQGTVKSGLPRPMRQCCHLQATGKHTDTKNSHGFTSLLHHLYKESIYVVLFLLFSFYFIQCNSTHNINIHSQSCPQFWALWTFAKCSLSIAMSS